MSEHWRRNVTGTAFTLQKEAGRGGKTSGGKGGRGIKLVKDEWIKNDLGSIEKKRRSASRDNRKLKRVKEDGRESVELSQGGESGVGVGS